MTGSIKSEQELNAMRESGKILATVLSILESKSAPGLTPKDMSIIAKQELKRLGGEPAFLGFYGFPDIICISVNNQVQHSIPSSTPFKAGDIVNYDFGVRYKGMITDAGVSVCIGGDVYLTKESRRLLDGTKNALEAGISRVKAGCRVGDISSEIEHVLNRYRLGIVRELVGHGVGFELHEYPEIPNYGTPGRGPILSEGMTIAIEPITTLGSPRIFEAKDGWTLFTVDGKLSAQFEHTVLVTAEGYEILTTLYRDI